MADASASALFDNENSIVVNGFCVGRLIQNNLIGHDTSPSLDTRSRQRPVHPVYSRRQRGASESNKQERTEVKGMSEKQERILETLRQTLPKISKEDQSYLLGYGEGIAAALKQREEEKE